MPNKRVYSFIPNERVGLLFWANFIGPNKRVGWKICYSSRVKKVWVYLGLLIYEICSKQPPYSFIWPYLFIWHLRVRIFHHFHHYKFIILRVVFKLFDWIDEKFIKKSPLRILKGEKTTTTPIPQWSKSSNPVWKLSFFLVFLRLLSITNLAI